MEKEYDYGIACFLYVLSKEITEPKTTGSRVKRFWNGKKMGQHELRQNYICETKQNTKKKKKNKSAKWK